MATSATRHIPRSPRSSCVGHIRGTPMVSTEQPQEPVVQPFVGKICSNGDVSRFPLCDHHEPVVGDNAPARQELVGNRHVRRSTNVISTGQQQQQSSSRNHNDRGSGDIRSQRSPSVPNIVPGEARGQPSSSSSIGSAARRSGMGSVASRLRAAVAQAVDRHRSGTCPTPPSTGSSLVGKAVLAAAAQPSGSKEAISSSHSLTDDKSTSRGKFVDDAGEGPSSARGDCGSGGGDGGVEEVTEETADAEEGTEEDDGGANSGASRSEAELREERFQTKLVSDEPVRRAPEVQVRPLRSNYVWLSLSPFPHRLPSIVFPPCDSPWEGDPHATVPNAYVTPTTLEPLVAHHGPRRRIGRKGKYEDICYSIPTGSVRFSAVLGTFGAAGFREADEGDDDDDDDVEEEEGDDPERNKNTRQLFRGETGWSVRWTKRVEPEEYKALHALQKINHFPGTWGIGRKDNLHKHLTKYLCQYGRDEYNFHPEAWLLPNDAPALARDMEAAEHAPRGTTRNVYIVKQVASACGRRMRLLCNGKIPKGKWLVQRYVDDPLLIYGYKFDLRLYVVVTSYLPLRVYLYQEGLVRFATTPYPTLSADNDAAGGKKSKRNMRVKSITAHLTNYSVNKLNGDAFVKPTDDGADEEKGSKWVLSTVQRYFKSRNLPWDATWKRIEDLIVKTLLSVEPDVVQQLRAFIGPRPAGYQNCFELYGFDVLLRENFDPVLMEVNIMPSLSTRCSLLDQRVKANMIADMLTLVGAYSLKKGGHRKAGKDTFAIHPFLSTLSPNELEAVCVAEEEYQRRGHFERLFPTATAHDDYRHLFREVKPLNALLCDWEKHKILVPPVWSSSAKSKTNKEGSVVQRRESVATSEAAGGASDTEDDAEMAPVLSQS